MNDNERDRFEETAIIAWSQGVAAYNWWYAIGAMAAAIMLVRDSGVRADAILLHAIPHELKRDASILTKTPETFR